MVDSFLLNLQYIEQLITIREVCTNLSIVIRETLRVISLITVIWNHVIINWEC